MITLPFLFNSNKGFDILKSSTYKLHFQSDTNWTSIGYETVHDKNYLEYSVSSSQPSDTTIIYNIKMTAKRDFFCVASLPASKISKTTRIVLGSDPQNFSTFNYSISKDTPNFVAGAFLLKNNDIAMITISTNNFDTLKNSGSKNDLSIAITTYAM